MTNREIDALIANKIFALVVRDRLTGEERPLTFDDLIMSGDHLRIVTLPHYSTDIAAAWLVVEQMIKASTNGDFHLEHLGPKDEGDWTCGTCRDDPSTWATADTAPLAICKAALKSVGIDV
jgi:hypothetical protein